MELKSVSRPIGESAHAVRKPPPIAERRLGAAPDKSIARTRTTMKRLAIGKSKRPLVRLGMETVIHNPDERTHIVETDEAPWRMVCALTIDGPARSSSPIFGRTTYRSSTCAARWHTTRARRSRASR